MAIKSEIQAKIQAALSLNPGISDWSELETYLHSDAESLLEAIYADVIQEDNAGVLTITTDNADFNYDLYFCKTGRKVLVYGSITSLGVFERGQKILDISLAEYQTTLNTYITANTSQGAGISIAHLGNEIFVGNAVSIGEIFRINYEYTVTN